jgi:Tfp pilus assembly protein PilN
MRPVNLLPAELQRQQSGGHPGVAYPVLGVLAVVLLMTVVYVFTSNQANSHASDSAQARQETQRLEARSKQLGPFGDFSKVSETRVTSVKELAKSRFDWERLMRELALVLPTGSWLQESNASVTGDLSSAGGGGGASASSASSQAGQGSGQPAAELVGCTPHQSDVARMMVRMRRMYRVDDVQLNESSQDENSNQVSADSCGSFYKFDINLSFKEAPSELPKGAHRVPSSLGGGS